MESTGVSAHLDRDLANVNFESADVLIARFKDGEPSTAISSKPVSGQGERRVRTLLVGTAAALVASILIVVQPWQSDVARASTPPILDFEFADARRISDAPGVDPTATLDELARAAQRQPPTPTGLRVQHVVLEGWSINQELDPESNSTITPTRTENWLYPDGRFRTRAQLGEPLKADGRGVPYGGHVDRATKFFGKQNEPAGSRDADYFANMPNTVEGVRDAMLDNIKCLERKRGQERTFCLTDVLHNSAQTYVIPPQVMANIWRMLAQEEGIRSLGNVTDRTGHKAVALSFIWSGAPEYRLVLLADPQTGQLVGHERILIKPSADSPIKPPAIEEFLAIVKSESQ